MGLSGRRGAGRDRCCEEMVRARLRPSVANSVHAFAKSGKERSSSNWRDHFRRKSCSVCLVVVEGKDCVDGSSLSGLGHGEGGVSSRSWLRVVGRGGVVGMSSSSVISVR